MKQVIVLLLVLSSIVAVLGIEGKTIDGAPICLCSRVYAPVCASNLKTYGNECLMDCESSNLKTRGLSELRVLKKSACEEDPVLSRASEILKEDYLEEEIRGEIPIEPYFQ